MRPLTAVAAALALLGVLVVAACGESGGSATTTRTDVTETTPAVDDYPSDPDAQETLDAFIQAAGARDTSAMWKLIDTRSQQRHGPTEQLWADGAGKDLVDFLGGFAREGGGYEPVLDRRISDQWSVAAVQGFIPSGDKEEWGAYAAVVGHEDGERKISLAGTAVFNPVVPEPELESDATPDVATEVQASEPILTTAMWVDQTPLEVDVSPDELFLTSRTTTPLEPGRHTIVSYADTQSGAGANAWTFVSG